MVESHDGTRTRPAWVDDELFPFESRFVEIDGNTVHYIDEGAGPTLLFCTATRRGRSCGAR